LINIINMLQNSPETIYELRLEHEWTLDPDLDFLGKITTLDDGTEIWKAPQDLDIETLVWDLPIHISPSGKQQLAAGLNLPQSYAVASAWSLSLNWILFYCHIYPIEWHSHLFPFFILTVNKVRSIW